MKFSIKHILMAIVAIIVIFFVVSKFRKKSKPEEPAKEDNSLALHCNNLSIENAKKFETNKLQLYTIDNFLSEDECKLLMRILEENQKPDENVDSEEETRIIKTDLTEVQKKEFIEYIDYKISQKMQIPIEYSEFVKGQIFKEGQGLKMHTDWFNQALPEFKKFCSKKGNRTWTFTIFLNDVEEGGELYFKSINHDFKPKIGQAVIWNNLLEDGSVNTNTLHMEKDVTKGKKYIITKWFREFNK